MMERRTMAAGLVMAAALGWFAYDYGPAIGLFTAGEGISAPASGVAQEPGRTAAVGQPVHLASVNPLSVVTVDALKQTIDRPLFTQSRAPKPEPKAEVAEVAEEPEATAEDFTLLAIVVADSEKTALLRWNKTNEVFRLKSGQSFSEWQVSEIGAKGLVIKSDELQFSLKLFGKPGQPSQPSEGDGNEDVDDQAVSRLEQ